MQTVSQNKKLDGAPREYFFPGGLKYRPQTIIASSQEEAEELHRKTRQPSVEPLPDNKEETTS